MTRTSRSIVVFRQPFSLAGVDGEQPPGSYTLEVDEELSFPAYRRVATMLFLSGERAGSYRIALIDPQELEAARSRDLPSAALPPAPG